MSDCTYGSNDKVGSALAVRWRCRAQRIVDLAKIRYLICDAERNSFQGALMSIGQLNNSLNTSYSTNSQATSKLDGVSTSLKRASTKLQTQLDSATASLSSLGKFKASVGELQTAAQGLSQFKTGTSSEDVKKKLASFIANFNKMVTSTKAAASDSSGVERISSGMTRAMSADLSRIIELRNMGFTRGSDGTLRLDATKFEAAYQASPSAMQGTLSKLGKLVDKAASKELASDGRIGTSIDAFARQTSVLKLQQGALLKATQQYASLMQSNTGSSFGPFTPYR
jgi:hypothetical protein